MNAAILGLALAALMAALDTSIANAGLPALAHALNAPFAQVQWIVLAYLLPLTSLIVGVGRLGDTLGRRRTLLGGIALFTAASVACGLAPNLPALLVARAVQGLGAAAMMALSVALVGETAPRERTGAAMGLLGTMSAIGTALGPSLGGLLVATVGWRALFWINLPVGILAYALVARRLPADRPAPGGARPAFDTAGALLLAGSLAAYALAMTVGNAYVLIAAAVGVALLARIERRAPAPLLHPAVLGDPTLRIRLICGALIAAVMMATLVVGPFYLAHALRLAPAHVGLALSVGPLTVALMGIPAGRLADRLGAQRTAIVGLGSLALGAALLSRTSLTGGLIGYLAPLTAVTIGYALFQTANSAAALAGVASDRRGVVSAMLSLSRNLGLITGASVLGAVFAWGSGAPDAATAAPEAVAAGVRAAYAAATGLAAVALALTVRRYRSGNGYP